MKAAMMSQENERISSDTFCASDERHLDERWLNARVGQNGLQDIITYAEGFRKAPLVLLEHLIRSHDNYNVDFFIYPIVFCARHSLELYLKDCISKIEKLKSNETSSHNDTRTTHNIGEIWSEVKQVGIAADRRYIDIFYRMESYVKDFSEIDPTGQAFRYPQDIYKTLHLKNIPLINLLRFKRRFEELTKILDELDRLNRDLVEEYSLKTFTSELSCHDLKAIAKRLPPKERWGDQDFDEIKQQIRTDYNLSSNQLSKALKLIKAHRTFASEIGIEIPLKHANENAFILFLQQVEKLERQSEELNQRFGKHGIISYSEVDRGLYVEQAELLRYCITSCKTSLSKEEIADILAIYELGKSHNSYCEFYEGLLDEQFSEMQDIDEHLHHYFDKTNLREFMEKGLRLLGQRKILSLIELFPNNLPSE